MATIKRRGNSFLFRCYDGYDQNGKQIERTMTWKIPEGMSDKKAEKEALHQAELFEERVRKNLVAEKRMKFADFADKWFSDYAEEQCRPKTIARYKGLMERINPALGHVYLDKIKPTHLTEFYKELRTVQKTPDYVCIVDFKKLMKEQKKTQVKLAEESGVSTSTIKAVQMGKTISEDTAKKISSAMDTDLKKLFKPSGEPEYLSGQTILHYHRLISAILQTAVLWQYIPANPAERVEAPKANNADAEYLDDKQAIELLGLMETQPIYFKTAVEVLLFTGMRRGELMGLQWDDIDFENNIIKIQRSLQYLPDKGLFYDETKTKSSHRTIKVPSSAILSLKQYREWQKKNSLTFGRILHNNDPVFANEEGKPMHPDSLTSWFSSFIKTTNLPQIHIHSLRHTNATLQIANGVSVTTVAGQLGHSNANTTTKVYAHAIQSAAAASADMMDCLLNPIRKQA